MLPFAAQAPRRPQPGRGRRTRVSVTRHGHYVRAALPDKPLRALDDLALDATLRAAALRRASVPEVARQPLTIVSSDQRQKIRTARTGNLILFVVDASGSMAARQRMVAVKGAILSLLLDAYQKRDQVGMIAFRGQRAELLLPPTNSVDQAERLLQQLPTGGRTPLADGLALADRVLRQKRHADEELIPLLVLLSDGRANVGLRGDGEQSIEDAHQVAVSIARRQVSSLVIDCEAGYQRLGLARPIANLLQGRYLHLTELATDSLTKAVRAQFTGPSYQD